jgi:hypothetical protein
MSASVTDFGFEGRGASAGGNFLAQEKCQRYAKGGYRGD